MVGTDALGADAIGTNYNSFINTPLEDDPKPQNNAGAGDEMPKAEDGNPSAQGSLPTLSPPRMGGIALELLVEALGSQTRQLATTHGLATLEDQKRARQAINRQKAEETAKEQKALEEKGAWDWLLKGLKIFGIIANAIGTLFVAALAVATLNPLLIAAATLSAISLVSSIVSEATDGKASFGAIFRELATACGASKEVAEWLSFAMETALGLSAAALSIVGAAGMTTAKLASIIAKSPLLVQKVTTTIANVARWSAIASAGAGVTKAGSDAAMTHFDYKIALSKADMKKFEAIMEKINMALQMAQDFYEAQIQHSNDLFAKIGEIVEGNSEAIKSVTVLGSPPMA